MGAKNKVIAGAYEGFIVTANFNDLCIHLGLNNEIIINKHSVAQYEVLDEDSRRSAASAVGRAFVGGVLFGGVGLLAGLSAKKKGIYTVALEFNDGQKSLIEIDEKRYKLLVKKMF
ncbi:MAG: hypothetical protein J6B86_04890 [Clostridia bacterium]|nr:hypothetical protein [Clostridia bacterium]